MYTSAKPGLGDRHADVTASGEMGMDILGCDEDGSRVLLRGMVAWVGMGCRQHCHSRQGHHGLLLLHPKTWCKVEKGSREVERVLGSTGPQDRAKATPVKDGSQILPVLTLARS